MTFGLMQKLFTFSICKPKYQLVVFFWIRFLASLLFCYNIGSDCKILDRLSSGFLFKNYTVRVRA
ncbi:hypothetical protein SCA6_000057 [Theobroma cacao]